MSIQKSIYNRVVSLETVLDAAVAKVRSGLEALERKAGLAYANSLHREVAKAKQTADLYSLVAEAAKRDAANAKSEAATVAKINTATARRLEAIYA